MSEMRVLILLPTWLGDSVMCTPAMDNLRRQLPDARLFLVCSPLVGQLFQSDPRPTAVLHDTTKSQGRRWLTIPRLGRQLRLEHGPFDLAFTFKHTLASRYLLRATGATRRIGARSGWYDVLLTDVIGRNPGEHCVLGYNRLVNDFFDVQHEAGPLTLYAAAPVRWERPTIGLAPGSAYGPARRWDPARFGEVAVALSRDFDVLIFGGPAERAQGEVIENALRSAGAAGYRNLIGQSVAEMVNAMSGLTLHIGNDSGATHIATALGIPVVVLFGPTSPTITGPWRHPAARIVQDPAPCAPCNRRVCPLKHHACMTGISVDQVLAAAYALIAARPVTAVG